SHVVRTFRPNIDDFVVLFTFGDQTVHVLLLEFTNFVVRFVHQLRLRVRNNQVVFTEGNTRRTRITEAELHHAVTEDHRLFLAAVAVNDVDQVRNFTLRQRLVQQRVRYVFVTWQQFGDHHTTRCRVD